MPSQVKTAILATSLRSARELQQEIEATLLGNVAVVVTEYCDISSQALVKKLEESSPEVVVVEIDSPKKSIRTVSLLTERIPDAQVFVASEQSGSELILSAMRAGAREFVTKPFSGPNLSQAFQRVLDERRRVRQPARNGQIYCVTSAKGGAGATTVAINLCASIAKLPETRVSLIDLGNPLGDAATYLNLRSEFTVTDALEAGRRLDSVMLESLVAQKNGFAVLPGLKEFQPDWTAGVVDGLKETLSVARQSFSHILVDLPCSGSRECLQGCAEASDAVLVVLTPELPTLWRTHRLLLFLDQAGLGDKVRLLVNRSHKNDEIGVAEIKKTLKRSVDYQLPNDYRRSIEAINSGRPLVEVNHCALASRYGQVAQSLTGISPKARKKGLFGLFS